MNMAIDNCAAAFLDEAFRNFRGTKRLADGAMSQLRDEEFFITLDPEANSVAIIVKHLAGNMRSRFTDFLATDGEKPNRNRDQEFILDANTTREDVMRWWENGWNVVFETVKQLKPEDVGRMVTIRGEPHTVMQAIMRQFGHYAYHCGQIIFLAKHFRSSDWKTLSIPRGKSAEANAKMAAEHKHS